MREPVGQCTGASFEERRLHQMGGGLSSLEQGDHKRQLPIAVHQREPGEVTRVTSLLHSGCCWSISLCTCRGQQSTSPRFYHAVRPLHLQEDAVWGIELGAVLRKVHGDVGVQAEEPLDTVLPG